MPPPPPRVEWHVGDRKVNGPPSRLSSKELLRQVTEAERLLQKLQDEQSSSERKLDRAKSSGSYYASMLVRARGARPRAAASPNPHPDAARARAASG